MNNPADLLKAIGITRTKAAFGTNEENEIKAAGFHLDEIIAREGTSSENLQNALFVSERVASTILSGDFERIEGSMEKFCASVSSLQNESGLAADLGGGAGLAALWAARNHPKWTFDIIDRAANTLNIGAAWANRIGIENVRFIRDAFETLADSHKQTYDLVVLDYVLTPASESEDIQPLIDEIQPALAAASNILRQRAFCYIRFGFFNELGLVALLQAAHNASLNLSYSRTVCESIGVTVWFIKDQTSSDHDASRDALMLFEELSRQSNIDKYTESSEVSDEANP
jgi:hypothetical protein